MNKLTNTPEPKSKCPFCGKLYLLEIRELEKQQVELLKKIEVLLKPKWLHDSFSDKHHED